MNYENLLDETKELFNKGEMLINEQQYDEAIDCFREAVDIQTEKYGEAHESTVACMTELGMALLVSGKHMDAKEVLDKTLANALTIFKHDCQEVANVYYLLGVTNMQLGNEHEAADNFNRLLAASTKLYGKDAEQTLSAKALYNKVMAGIGGSDVERQAVADLTDDVECYKRGNDCFEHNKEYLAPLYLKRAIEIREQAGKIDNDLIEYYRSLSVVYTELQMSDEALEVLGHLLELTVKVNGETDISVSGTHNLIGYNYMVKGENEKAIAHLNKCVALDIKIYGDKSVEVLRDYNVVANMYRMSDQLDKALATFIIVENLAAMTEDDQARDILVNAYTEIAAIYMMTEKYDDAHEYLHKKLHLCMHLFGKISREVYETYNQLLTVASKKNDDEEIAEILKEIDEIRGAIGMHDHGDGCSCGCHDHEHHHHDDDCDCGCHDHHHHDDDCGCGCHDHHEA